MSIVSAEFHSPSPPYVSPKTLLGFIDRLKQGLPTHIDRSLMNGYSGAVMSQMTNALKFLRLIGGNGESTDLLQRLTKAEGESRAAVIKEILLDSYSFLAQGFDLATATKGTLEQQFREMNLSGDTLRKCTLFLVGMAKEAGMPVSPHISVGSRSGGTSKSVLRRQSKKSAAPKVPIKPGGDNPGDAGHKPPTHLTITSVLLEKFPTFNPEWPDPIKGQWFTAFAELMERTK